MWLQDGMSETEKERRITASIKMLKGIQPSNELEGTLAVQMIATHEAAMECLRRSMTTPQTSDGHDHNLKHATKLLALFTQQLEALSRLRGKGQQKVTVEYVNIESGAQAVVGNVESKSSGAKPIRLRRHRPSKAVAASGAGPST